MCHIKHPGVVTQPYVRSISGEGRGQHVHDGSARRRGQSPGGSPLSHLAAVRWALDHNSDISPFARGGSIIADTYPPESDSAGLFGGLPGSLAAGGPAAGSMGFDSVVVFPFVVAGPPFTRVDPPRRGKRPRCWRDCRCGPVPVVAHCTPGTGSAHA